MLSFTRKKPLIGLMGSITQDTIQLASGEKRQELGGILYQAATLCGLGGDVVLIANIGEDLWKSVQATIRTWQGLKKEAVNIVRGPGNRVFLSYPPRGERKERLKSAVWPLTPTRILPYLNGLDFLLVAFNSGFDLDLITWRQVIRSCSCPIWLDIHSLVLSPNFGLRNYESFESWPAWVEGIAYLQANEKEAACLLGHPQDKPTIEELEDFAAQCFSLGVKAVYFTLGQRGVFVSSAESQEVLPAGKPQKLVDTTGCGDCLAASAVWKILQGESAHQAGRFGIALASRVASVSGVLATHNLVRRLAHLKTLEVS